VAASLSITSFQPTDQEEVRQLILEGLVERWGFLDPSKNPDLQDIASAYRGAWFLVARMDGKLVGSGALVPRTEATAEIVRMSVAAHCRRQGIGRQILDRLVGYARETGRRRIVLETTQTWSDAIRFYQGYGFEITHYQDGDVYFALDLLVD